MKNLFVSFLFSVISFISFSQSIILEYNQFNSFTSDKNFNVLTPSEVLQNKDIKTYQSEVCDIKYEIMVNEKKILIFNHGDLVGCEYLKSFQKTDKEIKFSFLTQEWYETEKKLTSFLVNLNTNTTLVYSNTENGLVGLMINNMGVSE